MRTQILSPRQANRALDRLAYEIIERNRGASNIELIGIRERGAGLAARLALRIARVEAREFARNRLEVEPYRDDRDFREPVADDSEAGYGAGRDPGG
jgi:pyrimidine operon attenuation protein / uracil phosphoribosyltransferase